MSQVTEWIGYDSIELLQFLGENKLDLAKPQQYLCSIGVLVVFT